jgi:hypothetical protein
MRAQRIARADLRAESRADSRAEARTEKRAQRSDSRAESRAEIQLVENRAQNRAQRITRADSRAVDSVIVVLASRRVDSPKTPTSESFKMHAALQSLQISDTPDFVVFGVVVVVVSTSSSSTSSSVSVAHGRTVRHFAFHRAHTLGWHVKHFLFPLVMCMKAACDSYVSEWLKCQQTTTTSLNRDRSLKVVAQSESASRHSFGNLELTSYDEDDDNSSNVCRRSHWNEFTITKSDLT